MRPWMFRKVLAGGNQVFSDLPVAQVTLVILFVQVVFVGAFLILLPLARLSRKGFRACASGHSSPTSPASVSVSS